MPADSSWKMPVVSPDASSSKVRRVVERDRVEVDRLAAVRADQVDCLAQDRQVRQPEEVELQQPQRLDRVHLVLGHQRVGVRRLLERHELRQRLAADDHPGRMRRRVAGDALELLGEVDDPLDRRVARRLLAELRASLRAPRRA